MESCELVTSISAMACLIAKTCPKEELSLIAAVLTQLGDTLATIDTHQSLCEDVKE